MKADSARGQTGRIASKKTAVVAKKAVSQAGRLEWWPGGSVASKQVSLALTRKHCCIA